MKPFFRISLGLLAISVGTQARAEQASLSKYDQLKVSVQEICPVSGKQLGSMGEPLKVKIGKEEIFLCCKGCTKDKINKDHWLSIHKQFASAQGFCPVMEKPLPLNPKSTTVNGQTVYICCPPCTKKIQADPRKYLTKVAGYYQAALKTDAHATRLVTPSDNTSKPGLRGLSKRDQMRVAVQKTCPVSGKPLGSMGTPQKVQAGGMELFLCCEGCKEGQIKEGYWKKVIANVAKAQGLCPVMEKKLPANPKSAVIHGQLVFVCCPPCTKKIEDDPAKFLAKIDSYYRASLSNENGSRAVRR